MLCLASCVSSLNQVRLGRLVISFSFFSFFVPLSVLGSEHLLFPFSVTKTGEVSERERAPATTSILILKGQIINHIFLL